MAKSKDNLSLWNELAPVNKEHIKNYKSRGNLTTVDPQWRLKRLTEMFGPVGDGWGYKILERWSEMECAFVRLSVWYYDPDSDKEEGHENWTGEQIGGTLFAGAPDDAYKSSITDALGKCASQIGVAADVYMGQVENEVVARITQDRVAEIGELLDMAGADIPNFCRVYGVATLSEMTMQTADRALRAATTKYESVRKKNAEPAVMDDPPDHREELPVDDSLPADAAPVGDDADWDDEF